MMKWLSLCLACALFCMGLPAAEIQYKYGYKVVDKELWSALYKQDFSAVEKLINAKKAKNTNQFFLKQFMMLYQYHKSGNLPAAEATLEYIDDMVRNFYDLHEN